MKKLNFSIDINAPAAKVWEVLWADPTYRQWTSAFGEGSHAVSDWMENSKVLFLGPNGDGMFSRIAQLVPGEFMSFEHLGVVKDGVEQQATAETKKWAGAREEYTLSENQGKTTLKVSIDMAEDFEAFFEKAFPMALEAVKRLSEA